MSAPIAIRDNAQAITDHLRTLALIRIAAAGYTIAAWAEARDLDRDWEDFR